jgi:hypothetical protein
MKKLGKTTLGKVYKAIRYLGPVLAHDAGYSDETQRRINAARSAYYAYRGFWHESIPARFRIIASKAVFLKVLHSAVAAAFLTRTDCKAMDRVTLCFMREIMHGAATYSKLDEEGNWSLGRGGTLRFTSGQILLRCSLKLPLRG